MQLSVEHEVVSLGPKNTQGVVNQLHFQSGRVTDGQEWLLLNSGDSD